MEIFFKTFLIWRPMYIMSLSEAKRVTKRISLRMSINFNSKEGNFFFCPNKTIITAEKCLIPHIKQ